MTFVACSRGTLLHYTILPIVITEDEFKTLALFRLANHRSTNGPRFLPVGVSGVHNWRGTIGKTVGLDGSRLDVMYAKVGRRSTPPEELLRALL